MLLFDRNGYNDLYDVYSSWYYAHKAASRCSSPILSIMIRREYHEGVKTFALWQRCFGIPKVFEEKFDF